jgi:hypothetical protein
MIDTYPASLLVLRLAILDAKEPVPEAEALSPLHWGDKTSSNEPRQFLPGEPAEQEPYQCIRCASWE